MLYPNVSSGDEAAVKRTTKNRKAVSTVIATVLMILIVVLGMSILFSYFVSYTGNYQKGQGSAVSEMVQVEDVWFKTNRIDICFYNYGQIPITVSSLYVNNVPSTISLNSISYANGTLKSFQSISPSLLEIPVGAHGNITVTNFPTSSTYDFKIVTVRGSSFEYISPQS